MTHTLANVTGRTEPAPVVERGPGVLLCVPIVTLAVTQAGAAASIRL